MLACEAEQGISYASIRCHGTLIGCHYCVAEVCAKGVDLLGIVFKCLARRLFEICREIGVPGVQYAIAIVDYDSHAFQLAFELTAGDCFQC